MRTRLSLRDYYLASGIGKLISDGAVIACYPLHDGTKHTIVSLGLVRCWLSHTNTLLQGSQRKLLYDEWASFSKFWKYQPLDAIRDYYGVKMGLYFAWLGECPSNI